MPKALFINAAEVKRFSNLSGSVDSDRFLNAVYLAQRTHIQVLLGTKLYEKLSNDIINDTLSQDYRTLLDEYIKPALVHFSLVELYPRINYQVSNKGIYKHNSENATSLTQSELDDMVERERVAAQFYSDRFVDFITFRTSIYPEYLKGTNGDISPIDGQTGYGIVFN